MNDVYLRSKDKQSLIDDLKGLQLNGKNVGFVIKDENDNDIFSSSGDGFVLDYAGVLEDSPSTYDEEGVELTPTTYLSGVHLNLRLHGLPYKVGALIHYDTYGDELDAMLKTTIFANGTKIVNPVSPKRVWA